MLQPARVALQRFGNQLEARPRWWAILCGAILGVGLLATLHLVFFRNSINNWHIFQQSFWHLISDQNLYEAYPHEHHDYYKYSPTFALLIAPLAILPAWLGCIGWNLLNLGVWLWGVNRLPLAYRAKWLLALGVASDLIINLQNTQSNTLMAGLALLGFTYLESAKPVHGALTHWLSAGVKIYGGAVGFWSLAYANQRVKTLAAATGVGVLFVALPMLVVGPHSLWQQYQNWFILLGWDNAASVGISFQGMLHSATGIGLPNIGVMAVSLGLTLLPIFVRRTAWASVSFRLMSLGAILLWMVVFNHKAESPTFILATTGAWLWFFTSGSGKWRWWLIGSVFVGTTMLMSDLFPAPLRPFFLAYQLKALPCFAVWAVAVWQLSFRPAAAASPLLVSSSPAAQQDLSLRNAGVKPNNAA